MQIYRERMEKKKVHRVGGKSGKNKKKEKIKGLNVMGLGKKKTYAPHPVLAKRVVEDAGGTC